MVSIPEGPKQAKQRTPKSGPQYLEDGTERSTRSNRESD